MFRTPRSWPMLRMSSPWPENPRVDVREITKSSFNPPSAWMISSTTPSAIYSLSGPGWRLRNGRTAIEGGAARFPRIASIEPAGPATALAGNGCSASGPGEHPGGRGDVFERHIAEVDDRQLEIIAQLFADRSRNHQASRLGKFLQARRQIDPRAVDIARFDDDVADVQPHAERYLFFRRLRGLAATHGLLDPGSALDGGVEAGETGEEPVSGILDDSARCRSNCRFDDLIQQRHQPRVRFGFVLVHQPRIAGDVGHQNCRERALHRRSTAMAAQFDRATPLSKAQPRG